MQKKTIISVLESNPLYRVMLKRMIDSIEGFVLDHMYEDLHTAYKLLEKPTDVVIVDLEAEDSRLIFPFIEEISAKKSVQVIACSQRGDDPLIRRAFKSGVIGYIVKESSYEEFRANLILALNGGMPLSRSITLKLMDHVRKDISRSPGKKLSRMVTECCKIIDEVLSAPLSVRQENLSYHLSRRIGISYHQLSVQFKREMGMTLNYYVLSRKIERVKHMIRENNLSLTQIANMMDYSSVAHLSAQFRKMTGITASNFKRDHG